MPHTHDVKKIKEGKNAELASSDAGFVTFMNVSGRSVGVGQPSVTLYPGDTAVACACHPAVADGVKNKKYKVISQSDAPAPSRAKKQKVEEPQSEETSTTVAEPEPPASVQLVSSEDPETPASDEV